jgi:RNA polymerase sigma-70 factor (ECF subfamily)
MNDLQVSGLYWAVGMPVLDFDDFYSQHYAAVVGSLRMAVGDDVEADDAAQEAFAKALLKWQSVASMDRPATWVYVVAIRHLRRQRRRARSRPNVDISDRTGSALDHGDAVSDRTTIERAIERLAPRQRLAIVLRFQADLTVPEVGRVMRCSEGTVKSTLHAALEHLQVDLSNDDLEGVRDGC